MQTNEKNKKITFLIAIPLEAKFLINGGSDVIITAAIN